MANTFELIASTTVGSGGAATIDFTSISSSYTDLCLVASTRDTQAGADSGSFKVTFNGSSTAAYSNRFLFGSGSSAGSGSYTNQTSTLFTAGGAAVSAGNTASTFESVQLYIPNYAGSNNKSSSFDSVGENNGTTAYATLEAGLWNNTVAINRITITATANFAQYSTAYLYGVKNA